MRPTPADGEGYPWRLACDVREDTEWAAYQLSREAAELHKALQLPRGSTTEWLAEVTQKYDILYSRTAALTEGQMAVRFGEVGVDQYEALVDNFVEDASEFVREQKSSSDHDTQVRAMHSIKGMAWTLGLTSIGDEAGAV